MNERELSRLIDNSLLLDDRIDELLKLSRIIKQNIDKDEIKGHIEKAENNLRFIKDNLELGYNDWCITGCYYASYHIVLALIMTKGYTSKNHLATLCILAKEFYKKGIEKEDITMINNFFMDYQDLLFYVESKNKRENASYSSKRYYVKKIRLLGTISNLKAGALRSSLLNGEFLVLQIALHLRTKSAELSAI